MVCATQQGLERRSRRAIADEDDVQICLLVEVHSPFDGGNDPRAVVAKDTAAKQREKHAVVAMASRIDDRRTQSGIIGGLEYQLGKGSPQPRRMQGIGHGQGGTIRLGDQIRRVPERHLCLPLDPNAEHLA